MKVKNVPIKKIRTKEFSRFIYGPTKLHGNKFCKLTHKKYNECKKFLCGNKNKIKSVDIFQERPFLVPEQCVSNVGEQIGPLDLSVIPRLDCSKNKTLDDIDRSKDTLTYNSKQYSNIVSEQSEPLDLSLKNVQSCSSFNNSGHRNIYHVNNGISKQTKYNSIKQYKKQSNKARKPTDYSVQQCDKQSNKINHLDDNSSSYICGNNFKKQTNCLLEQWNKQENNINQFLADLHNAAYKNNIGSNSVQTRETINNSPEQCNKQSNNAEQLDNLIEPKRDQPTHKPVEQCEQRYKALYLYKIFTELFPTNYENDDGLKVNNININNLNNVTNTSKNEARFDEKFNCLYCKKIFWASWELKKHMAVTFVRNNLTNKFHCCACAKMFAQKRYLQYHQRTHLDGNKFSCAFCSRKYTRSDNLARHNNFHSNPNKFSCLYCDKKFVRKDLMNKHLRVHENKFRYECTSCKRFFRGPISFENHNKIYHNL